MYSILPFGQRGLDSFFDDFERSFFPDLHNRVPAFRTDIKDEGDHFLLEAELPGFRKEDIDLDLRDGVLTISAKHEETTENRDENDRYVCRERRSGSFHRSFDVSGIRENDIGAAYDNGVLTLTLPKADEQPAQGRRIAIQ